MSNTVRWINAIALVLAGIATALFARLFLGFFTWGCYGSENATANNILYTAAIITLVAGIVPAVMLVRKTEGKFVVMAAVLGFLLTIASNGVFIFYTTNICQ